jgi:hypothetical protein
MGKNRTDHRAGQQLSGHCRRSRDHKQNRANDLQTASKLAKPLAGADFGKQFNPEDFALIKLDCSEIKEHQRRKARWFVAN